MNQLIAIVVGLVIGGGTAAAISPLLRGMRSKESTISLGSTIGFGTMMLVPLILTRLLEGIPGIGSLVVSERRLLTIMWLLPVAATILRALLHRDSSRQ